MFAPVVGLGEPAQAHRRPISFQRRSSRFVLSGEFQSQDSSVVYPDNSPFNHLSNLCLCSMELRKPLPTLCNRPDSMSESRRGQATPAKRARHFLFKLRERERG